MVGRRPNHAESALVALIKRLRYKEGKYLKTGVRWHRRSLKRADKGTGDFYANCVWGPFRGADGRVHPYEMDVAFPYGEAGVDFEVDGIVFHSGEKVERDRVRDETLKAHGWTVCRITTEQVYHDLVPLLNRINRAASRPRRVG